MTQEQESYYNWEVARFLKTGMASFGVDFIQLYFRTPEGNESSTTDIPDTFNSQMFYTHGHADWRTNW